MKTENYVRELLFILFRQKRVIAWVTALTFAAAVLVAFVWPPTYAATGQILVRAKKAEKTPQAIEEESTRTPELTKGDLSSEEQILVSTGVIEQAITGLMQRKQYPVATGRQLVKEVYRVQRALKTELVGASNVIEVRYQARDPQLATTVLGALMDTYLGYRNRVHNPVEAGDFFRANAERSQEKLAAKQTELLALIRQNSISDPKTEKVNNLALKYQLEVQLNELLTAAIDKEALVRQLDRSLEDGTTQLFSFIDNVPAIIELSKKVEELLVERGAVLRAYKVDSDRAQLVTRHLEDTHAALRKEVLNYRRSESAKLQAIRDKIASIRERMAAIDAANITVEEQLIAMQRLQSDIEVFQASYGAFSRRREEAGAVSGDHLLSQVSIVTRPFPSNGPVFPKKRVVIPFGLLVGFLNGFVLGFLIEYFDHRFKRPSDVEHYTGLPVLASIAQAGP
jgi:uncharacterized protein involved in exopolysaccharide biosynthesis